MQINKGQTRLTPRWQGLRFHLRRGKGHLGKYFKNRFQWHLYPRLKLLTPFPMHVDLELSSACDMRCPMCYTTTEEFKRKVEHTIMKEELFKRLVDECSRHGTYSIRLSLRGEPFVHPRFVALARYAKEKGIPEVSSLTNGLKLNPEMFEELVEIGMDWLTISFDGWGETYNRIRKPATFEEAYEKVRIYHEIKKRKGSVKPVIKIQSVWPAIAENPKKFYDLFNGIADLVATNPLIDYLHKDRQIAYIENFTCPVLWQRLAVGADGQVMFCSNDEYNEEVVGDANHETLYDIWRGDKLEAARRIHLQHLGVEKLAPCRKCYYPRKTVTDQRPLGRRMIAIENYSGRVQEIGK